MAQNLITGMQVGTPQGRASLEALLQVRSLLVGNERNANAIAYLDAAIAQFGWSADTSNAEMMWALIRHQAFRSYVEAGEHCYEVSPGLAEGLTATELRGVTGKTLRLPFDSIAIVVPEELQDVAQVVFVSMLPANTVHNTFTGETITTPVLSVVAFGNDGTYIDTYAINPSLDEGDIRHALAESLRLYRNDDPSALDDDKNTVTRLFWWTVNVCLYITHSGAESEPRHPNADAERSWQKLIAEPGPKRRQRLLNLYNAKFRPRIYLGRSVEPLGLKTRGPMGVRTLVAGHWRNQVCGVGRQDRRLTWIEPFWRGLASGPISNPVRVVTTGRAEQSHAAREAA